MADNMKRYFFCGDSDGIAGMDEDSHGDYVKHEDVAAFHADIIDQGRKVQIAASGESKYGAMSAGEYIEWALGKLEGK